MARILQVCNTDFYLGRFLAPLVLDLAARGHAVECVCEGHAADPRLAAAGIVTHDFRFPRKGSPIEFAAAVQRMRTVLRKGRFDCVNSHNRNASIVARVAAWLENVPVNLYTAHGFYFHDAQPRWLRELTVLVEAALARVTCFTLSQSAEDLDFMVRRRIIAPERIAYIGNGIDVERFSPRFDRPESENRLGLDRCPFRIATTGRIVKEKGFEDLLVAFARFASYVPQSQLVMIGGNISQDIEPFQNKFAARIETLGLSELVRITGIVENVEEYLATADLFVLPSYREGMPRSLIEAMSMGLPCIATDIRGCREVVSDQITGFIYPPRDVDALVALMKRCFSNRAELATIASRARMAVVRDFSENAYVARQVAAIERLLVKFARVQ